MLAEEGALVLPAATQLGERAGGAARDGEALGSSANGSGSSGPPGRGSDDSGGGLLAEAVLRLGGDASDAAALRESLESLHPLPVNAAACLDDEEVAATEREPRGQQSRPALHPTKGTSAAEQRTPCLTLLLE